MVGVSVVSRQNADADTLQLRKVAMETTFFLPTGYNNFGCVIASDTLFASRGGFSRSSYPKKT